MAQDSDRPGLDAAGSTTSSQSPFLARWGTSLLTVVLGAGLSLLLFVAVRGRERTHEQTDFERQAAQLALAVQSSFEIPLEVLRSVPAFFEASDEISRDEFSTFVRSALGRYPWIYALEWIPRVPHAERMKFEQLAASDGFAGYHFKQDGPHGKLLPAENRPEYFPLFYMEPPNRTALGLEETALPVRRVALERARDTGKTAITERLKLVQDDPSVLSVIAFHPVYARGERPVTVRARRESLRGFAAVVFRVRPVIENALRRTDLHHVDVGLVDVDAESERSKLYESRGGATDDKGSSELASAHTVNVGGRPWSIQVTRRDGFRQADRRSFFWLAVGLLASALAGGLAYTASTVLRLRRQVRAALQLGQYTLSEKLGEGGMGTVYRAHHALLRRPTAVKLLHPAHCTATAVTRFEREVQLMSALTHPNTAIVYDYGHTPEGIFYYAMEYIDGITLQELVDADGAQPAGRIVHILSQMCMALAEAHAMDWVHRDVKPANVMLCNRGGIPDFVKVLDFGLVKELANDAAVELSQSTTLLGTPNYIAPEAIVGAKPVDARVDVYAVGAVAYFLLTGDAVFTGGSILEICAKHLSLIPDPPSERLGEPVLPELEALVMRCLEKDPDARPKSAAELGTALSELVVPPWTKQDAFRWWQERAPAIEQHIRSARAARTHHGALSTTVGINAHGRAGTTLPRSLA
jgi:serine/threonine protein kinase/CHASE1-domain containing sensor protein